MVDEILVRCFMAGKAFGEGIEDLINMLSKYHETDGRIAGTLGSYGREVINVPPDETLLKDIYINLVKDKFRSVLFEIGKCKGISPEILYQHPLIQDIETALERKDVRAALEILRKLQVEQERVLADIMR